MKESGGLRERGRGPRMNADERKWEFKRRGREPRMDADEIKWEFKRRGRGLRMHGERKGKMRNKKVVDVYK
jgi:hypothetical protein